MVSAMLPKPDPVHRKNSSFRLRLGSRRGARGARAASLGHLLQQLPKPGAGDDCQSAGAEPHALGLAHGRRRLRGCQWLPDASRGLCLASTEAFGRPSSCERSGLESRRQRARPERRRRPRWGAVRKRSAKPESRRIRGKSSKRVWILRYCFNFREARAVSEGE